MRTKESKATGYAPVLENLSMLVHRHDKPRNPVKPLPSCHESAIMLDRKADYDRKYCKMMPSPLHVQVSPATYMRMVRRIDQTIGRKLRKPRRWQSCQATPCPWYRYYTQPFSLAVVHGRSGWAARRLCNPTRTARLLPGRYREHITSVMIVYHCTYICFRRSCLCLRFHRLSQRRRQGIQGM